MRGLVRVLAALISAVIVALGALVVIELICAFVAPERVPVSWLAARAALDGNTWNGQPVRIVAGTALVLGLLLASIAISAGRRELRLQDPAADVTVTTDRRSIARWVGHRVRQDDDVDSATVIVNRKRVRIKAVAAVSSADNLRPRLSETAEQTVQALSLLRQPRISVSVARAKEKR